MYIYKLVEVPDVSRGMEQKQISKFQIWKKSRQFIPAPFDRLQLTYIHKRKLYIENYYIENQYFRSTCSVKSGQSGSKKRNGAAGPGKERRMRLEEMVDEAAKQQVNICSTFAEFFITFAVHFQYICIAFVLHLQYNAVHLQYNAVHLQYNAVHFQYNS